MWMKKANLMPIHDKMKIFLFGSDFGETSNLLRYSMKRPRKGFRLLDHGFEAVVQFTNHPRQFLLFLSFFLLR
jgi:hypothetical protein